MMKSKLFSITFYLTFIFGINAQNIDQEKTIPLLVQEKIYITTDKPYYLVGETIFYRLFLLDASTHSPLPLSRYVYVELIDIRTKGGLFFDRRARFHLKSVMPLGYSTPAEFYSPQYDTPEKRNAEEPDLRTAIYWTPTVDVNADGKAAIEFYSADKGSTYSVVTEGVCPNGTLLYRRKKGFIKVESQVR
jgi:hypothetical protein